MDRPRSPSPALPRPMPPGAPGQGRSPSPLWDESPSPRMHSPARGRPRSYQDRRAPSDYSRSRSRSRLSSRSRSRLSTRSRSRSDSRTPREKQHDHHKGLFKTSAGLLAGIGVATFLAHKVWPKGIIYGDVEDWANKKLDQKHKHHQEEKRRRPEPQRRTSEPHQAPRRNQRNEPPRVIERVRERGNVTYREEIVPIRKGDGRRRDLEARGFERVGRNSQPLPYPDRAYPDERFYGPSPRMRPGEPVFR